MLRTSFIFADKTLMGATKLEEAELATLVSGELIHQYRRLMIRGLTATPLASPLIYWMLRDEADSKRVVAWIAVAIVGFLTSCTVTLNHHRLAEGSLSVFAIPAFLIGSVWGALPVVAAPQNPVAQAILILVLASVCAVAAVMNAPSQLGFFAMSVAITVPASIYLMRADDPRLRNLTPLAGMLFGLMWILHREVHRSISSAIHAKVTNDLLLIELQSERQKIETSNTALMKANRQLNHRATHDPLTGLLNRSALVDRLDALVGKASPSAGVAVMYMDLDRFKLVNDSLGHHVGDELLRIAANRCTETLGDSVIARLGGDEFCVVMYPIAATKDVEQAAHRLRLALDLPIEISGRTVSAPVSIGIAVSYGHTTPSDLQRFADLALYQAKDRGRNQVALFDQQMRDSMDQVVDQGSALRAALNAKLIVPWFQPEVSLATGEMIGAEALARWITPNGVVSAGSFMSIAGQVGLEGVISDEMMTAALTARYKWHHLGIDPSFRLRVNVTADQLSSQRHVNDFLAALSTHGIPASGVSLEITENSVIRDLEVVSAGLQQVRNAGVTVALDDFGTGRSSLSLLQMLPIDAVKIDRSFIGDLSTDSRDRALVRSVVALATELGLTVTAEGVETNDQVTILQDMGCTSAQGFLFAPAIPGHELLQRLQRPMEPLTRPTTHATFSSTTTAQRDPVKNTAATPSHLVRA
jgi:diguanylate cyclase (GGDEF)-like protein